jgi:putative membrane protein
MNDEDVLFKEKKMKGFLNQKLSERRCLMKSLLMGLIGSVPLSLFLNLGNKVFGQWRGQGGWEMGPGMMGWGYGMGWFGPIFMVIFWIAVIVGIIFLIRWLVVSTRGGSSSAKAEDSALEILKRRYARGEINKEEFEEKKKDLV